MIDRILWLSTSALTAVLLLRLAHQRLWTRAPFGAFAIMLAASLARDVVPACVHYGTPVYTLIWEITLPVILLCHAAASLSTYRAIARLYPRIGRFAVWLFAGSLVAASIICLSTLFWELQRSKGSILHSMFLLFHWVDGLAAGALVVACAFLGLFPRPLKAMPTNLMRHTGLLAVYFSAYALVFAVENLLPKGSPVSIAFWMERSLFAFVAGLYCTWAFCLSRAGESSEPWPELTGGIARRIDTQFAWTRQAAK